MEQGRTIMQAQLKTPGAVWLQRLWQFELDGEGKPQAASKAAPPTAPCTALVPASSDSLESVPAAQDDFVYGYDSIHQAAWRCLA
eukprot:10860605-Alexandrium_andersonii.AAC.1